MSKFGASIVDVYVYLFQKIINKNFHPAISLMKTRLPDDHQCHAVAKYEKFCIRFTINCLITCPLSEAFLICCKLHVKLCHTGFLHK